jgi:hypothetical protein
MMGNWAPDVTTGTEQDPPLGFTVHRWTITDEVKSWVQAP